MSHDLVTSAPSSAPAIADATISDGVKERLRDAFAGNTRRAYQSRWKAFEAWCAENQRQALPATPETVATFLDAMARGRGDGGPPYKLSTIEQAVAAIGFVHDQADAGSPTAHKGVRETMKGIRRDKTLAAAPAKKQAAVGSIIADMIAQIDTATLAGKRDRALLAFGMLSAMRRSELVALEVGHLTFTENGVSVFVPRSKTDQTGKGQTIAVPQGKNLRPVEALRDWMDAAGIKSGPVFRGVNKWGQVSDKPMTGRTVANIVKRHASSIGRSPSDFAGHSLRSGFVTSAATSGARLDKIMAVSRHAKVETVMGYVRDADAFNDHAGASFA